MSNKKNTTQSKTQQELSALWEEIEQHSPSYKSRNKSKVSGSKAKEPQYHSQYRKTRDVYIKSRLGSLFIKNRRRLTDIKNPEDKKRYIQQYREMHRAAAPLKKDVWEAYKSTHNVHKHKRTHKKKPKPKPNLARAEAKAKAKPM